MKKNIITIIFFCIPVLIQALNVYNVIDYYLVPHNVYVGDRASLVITPPPVFNDVPAFLLLRPNQGTSGSSDVLIERIELSHKNGNTKLLVDFIPFVPDFVTLPAIAAPDDPSLVISDLAIKVTSVLNAANTSLAQPASVMSAPGTGLLVFFGFISAFIILVISAYLVFLGKKHLLFIGIHIRKKRLVKSMILLLRRLEAECTGSESDENLFSLLSGEFRKFLTGFTETDCRALTPAEFSGMELPSLPVINGQYLGDLFGRWELFRFSGLRMEKENFLNVLAEVKSVVINLARVEKK